MLLVVGGVMDCWPLGGVLDDLWFLINLQSTNI